MQLAERAGFFEDGRHPADRIFCAVDPRVVMIAAEHPLIGKRRSAQAGDDVVERLLIPAECELEVRLACAGSEVIRDRQPAAPVGGHDGPRQRREQRLRIRVRDRHHRNPGQRRRVLDGEPPGVRGRADAGGQWIARIDRHIHDAAALRPVGWTHRAVGKYLARAESVISGIGVDETTDGAVLSGDLGLDAAPRFTVACDDDRALHRNAVALQDVVVLWPAVIHVDERAGDVAVDRVGVIGRKLFVLLV